MSKWKLENHIIGKAYDLTQENMNKMISDVERLARDIESIQRQLNAAHVELHDLRQECIQYSLVLDQIARCTRSDGTYDLSRKDCETLAKEVLGDNRMSKALD